MGFVSGDCGEFFQFAEAENEVDGLWFSCCALPVSYKGRIHSREKPTESVSVLGAHTEHRGGGV